MTQHNVDKNLVCSNCGQIRTVDNESFTVHVFPVAELCLFLFYCSYSVRPRRFAGFQ